MTALEQNMTERITKLEANSKLSASRLEAKLDSFKQELEKKFDLLLKHCKPEGEVVQPPPQAARLPRPLEPMEA